MPPVPCGGSQKSKLFDKLTLACLAITSIGAEELEDVGFEEGAEGGVGVADPGDGGGGVEGGVEGLAAGVGDEDAGLFGDEECGDVVGVAGEPPRGCKARTAVEFGADVGVEAVLSGGEVEELACGADVLVVEDGGEGGVGVSGVGEDVVHHFAGVDFGGGEEVGDHGEAVGEVVGGGGPEGEWLGGAGAEIEAVCGGGLAFDGPGDVGEGHFGGGEFGHDGGEAVSEAGVRAEVGCDGGEGPGGAFVVHEAAGAVDGVDDEADVGVRFGGAFGEGFALAAIRAFDAFGDEDEGGGA